MIAAPVVLASNEQVNVTELPASPRYGSRAASPAFQFPPDTHCTGLANRAVRSAARIPSATAVSRILSASHCGRLGPWRSCSADPTVVGETVHGTSSYHEGLPE